MGLVECANSPNNISCGHHLIPPYTSLLSTTSSTLTTVALVYGQREGCSYPPDLKVSYSMIMRDSVWCWCDGLHWLCRKMGGAFGLKKKKEKEKKRQPTQLYQESAAAMVFLTYILERHFGRLLAIRTGFCLNEGFWSVNDESIRLQWSAWMSNSRLAVLSPKHWQK